MAEEETKDSTTAGTNAPTINAPATTSDAVVPTAAGDTGSGQGERKARVVVEYIGGEETDEEPEEGGEDAGDPATEDLLAMYPDNTEVRVFHSASFLSLPSKRCTPPPCPCRTSI